MLLIIARGPILGSDGQAPPGLCRDTVDEAERDEPEEVGEGELSVAPAGRERMRRGGVGLAFKTARV